MGVLKLNGKEYGGGSGGSGSEDVELTIAEYIALPDTKLSDDKNYFITDINNDNVLGYPPLIYSDNEREVGVWRDGKPLYQRTWEFSSAITIQSNTWTETTISNSDIESIAQVVGHNLYADKISCFNGLFASADTGRYIRVMQTRNNSIPLKYLTLWYTKLSDTPGAGIWNGQGGIAHHYSTSETVIGTWYNGKPIYEKTYELSSALLVEYTSWTNTTIDSSNIQTVIDAKGYNADGTFYGTVMADPTRNSHALLGLQTTRNGSQANVKVLTIQYTKITD